MAQVIIYGKSYPTYLMGTGKILPDGSLEVQVPIAAPPVGTPIQVVLFWMGGQKFIEGTTTAPDAGGSFGISTTTVVAGGKSFSGS